MMRIWKGVLRAQLLRATAILVLSAQVLLLAGCWDEVNLQDIGYITALGVDYVDSAYVLHAQMIGFSAIAKTESPQPQADRIWIGTGKGESVMLAFFNLTRTGYNIISLEHLKTIVVHERALGKISDVLDGLNRQRASRYTSWLYGTKEALEHLFNTDNFFDQSPINSTMYLPDPHEQQYTFATPLSMQTAVQMLKEQGMTTVMPSLNTSGAHWKRGKKPMNTHFINGVHVFKNFDYQGFALEKKLRGIRWISDSFHRVLEKAGEGEDEATIAITKSKPKLVWSKAAGNPAFQLNLTLTGHIVEMDGKLTKEEITKSIEARVKKEMTESYQFGVENGMDLFNLEHHLYRYHLSEWKEQTKNKGWRPAKDSLTIHVKLNLTDSGKFDLINGSGT